MVYLAIVCQAAYPKDLYLQLTNLVFYNIPTCFQQKHLS